MYCARSIRAGRPNRGGADTRIQWRPGLQPDIIVRHPGGLPVVVETEYTPARTVEDDARQRLGKSLESTGDPIEQALAIRIPQALASVSQNELEEEIERATLEFCILAGDPQFPQRWPATGWLNGTVDDLAAVIELAAHSENRIARGMQILEAGIHQAAGKLRDECADAPDTLENIAQQLHQKDGEQTSRMAMAIVANALTFHSSIAGAHRIDTLDQLRGLNGRPSKRRLLEHGDTFSPTSTTGPSSRSRPTSLVQSATAQPRKSLERLFEVASDLVSLGATSQHDLCGRMFQRLITDRKFLATFYTLPSSAALLAELAVPRLDIDWSDSEAVTELRIGDFACGTGALLNAAYEAVLSRYRRRGGDDRQIHPSMMEHAVVGADIMPAATHLTASVLSSTHPSVPFENTSIITLPYGAQPEGSDPPIAIGALDLIQAQRSLPLFVTRQRRVRGVGEGDDEHVELPHGGFDLVIMNPPFTRSTGHEAEKIGIPAPAFAGFATTDDEMRHMSHRLGRIRRKPKVGRGNAGLASYFVDLAHAKVKSAGGVLALVLPASFLQGESWAAARRLLGEHYKDVVIVSIAATGTTDTAFSADTGMAEVLVVATRKSDDEETDGSTLFVNLQRRPQTILEAATIARSIQRIPASLSVGMISVGNEQSGGRSIRATLSDTGCAGLREASVMQAATGLLLGELRLPRLDEPIPVGVATLADLGDRGLYHMDISGTELNNSGFPRGPFDIVDLQPGGFPTWPVLWSHTASRETQMTVLPDSAGEVRPGCEGRATDAWRRTASRLHFNRDFRINSQPLAACLTPAPTIGGRAWPNFLCSDQRWETPLVLWANTTLGLISFWWIGTRQQQGRAILTISKLPALTVLDSRRLTEAQLDCADDIFEDFRHRELLPANEAWRDETRQALDRAVLIDLLCIDEGVLEPLALLRRQWCSEPSVHGGKGTAPV